MTGLSLKTRRAARRHRVRYSFHFMRASGAQLDEITKLIDTKVLRPIIDRAYPFDEAPQALAHVERAEPRARSHHNGLTPTRLATPTSRACRRRFRCTCNARQSGRPAPAFGRVRAPECQSAARLLRTIPESATAAGIDYCTAEVGGRVLTYSPCFPARAQRKRRRCPAAVSPSREGACGASSVI
jgi:hypothetical protein